MTADPDELDVGTLNDETAQEFDRFLESALRHEMAELHSWTRSKFVPIAGRMNLLTAYSVVVGGADWRVVVRHLTIADRRFALMGLWESSRSAHLAEPIYISIMEAMATPSKRVKQQE